MKSLRLIIPLFFLCADASAVEAHEILAKYETEALSERDRAAAANAEKEALDRDQLVQRFEWQGPDGASGFIIVGGEYPDNPALGRCRAFIHIVRHKNDGGVNPTFRGKVCRDWDGKWSVQ